jgi:hypothetical protein
MIYMAFFFLLRPGEYTYTTNNTPFRFQDIQLYIGQRQLRPNEASPTDLEAVNAISLCFTTRKMGSKAKPCPTLAVETIWYAFA